MIAFVFLLTVVAGLAGGGAWFVERLGKIDRRVYAELCAQERQELGNA